MRSTRATRVVLAGVIFVTLLAQVVLYPGLAGLVTALGAETDLNASMWFLAAEFSAFIAFAAVWGYLSDRAGVRIPFIVLGAILAAFCYLAMGAIGLFASLDFTHVLAIRVVQGASTIGAFSLAMTMLMDLSGGHGRNMGAAGIAIGSGTAIGAPFGGFLSGIDSLLPLFVTGVLFLLVVPLVLSLRERAPDSDRPGLRGVIRDLIDHPALSIPYAFGFVDRLTAGTFSLVGVYYFDDAFGLGPMGIGLMLMLFFAPFALFQYPSGIISDRIGRLVPVVGGSICYGTAIVMVGQASSIAAVGVVMLVVGIFGAVVSPATMALVTDITPGTRRGTSMAGFNIAGSLGFLTGILLGGTIAGVFGYATAFAVVGGFELLIAVLALPLFYHFSIETIPRPAWLVGN